MLAFTHLIRSASFWTVVIFLFLGGGSLWQLYLAVALFGFGWFTTAPLAYGLVADLFGFKRMGTIIGLLLSSHVIGMALGAYAGGISYELTHSYFRVFLAQGILEFVAAALVFTIGNKAVYQIA